MPRHFIKSQRFSDIVNWFEPPVFKEDKEKTHKARLLNIVVITVIIFIVIVVPVAWSNQNISIATKKLDSIVLLFDLSLWYWLHKGMVIEVGYALLIFGFVSLTAINAGLGILLTPTTTGFIFLVIVSGILFGLVGIFITVISSSIILGAFIIHCPACGDIWQADFVFD